MADPFENRAVAFLRFVADEGDRAPADTAWGPYRAFDGHALACLATGRLDRADRLLGETLELIDISLAREAADPAWKWHLADFALHPLYRAWRLLGNDYPALSGHWQRVRSAGINFRYHFGDLTENHNLLHLSLRFLFGGLEPQAAFLDGRAGTEHRAEARGEILQWIDRWFRLGSGEWGSDIYTNVNLLALLNLVDFAEDPAVAHAARATVDAMLLDEALDHFAGAAVGAARRSYGAYRVDAAQSPSRPLLHLCFGDTPTTPVTDSFNLNFVGGVIQAATSTYRPPAALSRIAHDPGPFEHRATHRVETYAGDHVSRYTFRHRHAMLSAMLAPPGNERSSEHLFQATLSEQAIVFANHPNLLHPAGPFRDVAPDAAAGLALQESAPPDRDRPLWTYGNSPPSFTPFDVRPGFWQGNVHRPRSYGQGRTAVLIFNIPPDDPLPWPHVYFPRHAFDEVIETDGWVFARRGRGYVGLYATCPTRWTTTGVWADAELRLLDPACAIVCRIGSSDLDGSFDAFRADAVSRVTGWDKSNLTITLAAGGEPVAVSYADGSRSDGRIVDTGFARFQTPWGTMPAGSAEMQLDLDGDRHVIAPFDNPTICH